MRCVERGEQEREAGLLATGELVNAALPVAAELNGFECSLNALREFGDRLGAIVAWSGAALRAQSRVGKLATKRDQLAAIRNMLEGEIEAAERNLDRTRQLYKEKYISESELRRDEQRVAMLKRALR